MHKISKISLIDSCGRIRPYSGYHKTIHLQYFGGGTFQWSQYEIEGASNIIVALDQKRGVMPFRELLNCKLKGISITDGESFYERITGKLLVEKITFGSSHRHS